MGSEVFDWSHNKDQWLAAVTKRCNKEPATGTKSYGKQMDLLVMLACLEMGYT